VQRNKNVAPAPGLARSSAAPGALPLPTPVSTPAPVEEPLPTISDPRAHAGDGLLDMPGAYATTNSAPLTPAPSKP
jgi:hypothetical protein